jgi:hypothetical protein
MPHRFAHRPATLLATGAVSLFAIAARDAFADEPLHVRTPHEIFAEDAAGSGVAAPEALVPPPTPPSSFEVVPASAELAAPAVGYAPPAARPAPKPPAAPKPFNSTLFLNDFSYVRRPGHPYVFWEDVKEIPLDECDGLGLFCEDVLSFGGELRHRYMDEANRLRPGGAGRSDFQQWRWRNYVDWRGDGVRVYFEGIDASHFGEELPTVPIDVNRWDVQNAFVDLTLFERDGRPVILRSGRQELQYGSQHLVSPLDWANTRRNFEGFKLSSPGEVWDVDAFATRGVNGAAGNTPHPESADHTDASRTFSGVYSTWHGVKDQGIDLYWLWLREQEPIAGFADGSRHTVGLRWFGKRGADGAAVAQAERVWDWDFEGAYQFGHDNGATGTEQPVQAGFLSAMFGHTWSQAAWKPRLGGIWYLGSGDRDPNDGVDNTFSILYPLNHAYWGVLDNLAGQNLIDYGLQATVQPTDKLNLLAAYHWFDLTSNGDRAYNVAGVPVGVAGTGKHVGDELDLIATYVVNVNFDVQVGYSWFWYGGYVDNGPLRRDDAHQFYVMSTLRY